MAKKKSTSSAGQKPNPKEPNEFYEVRKSGVHGYGGFAKQDLKKGQRITEYLGDRVSHKEADEQLARTPLPLPRLAIKRRPPSIFEYQYEDFEIVNYQFHPAIKAPVAV